MWFVRVALTSKHPRVNSSGSLSLNGVIVKDTPFGPTNLPSCSRAKHSWGDWWAQTEYP